MRSIATSRPVFSLAVVFAVITVGGMKQQQIIELLAGAQWQCRHSLVMSAFRILVWLLFDEGRAIIAAIVTALSVLSVLYWRSAPEAKDLTIAIGMLLAFLIFMTIQAQARPQTLNCIQTEVASLTADLRA